jgi:hypothetical protein
MNNYRTKKCREDFSNLNNTLKLYKKERHFILSLLESNPEELSQKIWNEYLSFDRSCMKNSGYGNIYSSNSCIPCHNLSIMLDHDKADVRKHFSFFDKDLIVIKNDLGKVGAIVSENDKQMAEIFLKKNKILLSCGSQEIEALTFFKSGMQHL